MRRALDALLNFFFPPICPVCRKPVATHGDLCAACWKELSYISSPFCGQCGVPLEISSQEVVTCGKCLLDPPPFLRTRAVFVYNPLVKRLILRFKDYQATYLGRLFAQWMVQKGLELLEEADCIIPVPLHWKRLVMRGYNQAALLSRALGKLGNKPVFLRVLRKPRATPSQGTLSALARHENVKSAYKVPASMRRFIVSKRILLVDDVMSSGATLKACAKVLLQNGACAVDVLVVARAKLRGEGD